MSRSSDLLLFFCAVSFGGYLVATSEAPTTSELSQRQNNVFSAFERASIREIHIVSEKGEVELQKKQNGDSRYFLGARGEPADEDAVDELLTSLQFAQWERRLAAPIDLDDLGLRNARGELELVLANRRYRLLLGKDVPQEDGHIYAGLDTGSGSIEAGTIKAELWSQLARSEQAFHGKVLFPLAKSKTQRLVFGGLSPAQPIVLRADPLGFLLERPDQPPIRAERKLVDLLFYHLSRANLEQFLPNNEAESLLKEDPETFRLEQYGVSGLASRVALGSDCGEKQGLALAVKREPQAVAGCLPSDVPASLRIPWPELIDYHALPFQADEIDHVVIEADSRRLDLLRRDTGYVLVGRDQQVPKETADELLAVLAEGRLELLDHEPPSKTPVGTLTAKAQTPRTVATGGQGQDALHELTVELFSQGGDLVLHRLDDGAWLEVPSWFRWAFSGNDAWARDHRLVDLGSSEIESVRIARPDGSATTLERTAEGLTIDGQYPADLRLARDLLATLADLHAARFLVASDRSYTPSLEVTFSDGKRKRALFVGKRTRGGYEAWTDFTDGVFVITLDTYYRLQTTLFDRSPALLDPDDIRRLKVTVGERQYSFRHQGGDLVPVGGLAFSDLREPLRKALLGLEVGGTALVQNVRGVPGRPVARLEGSRIVDGQNEQFSMTWGAPVEFRGYPHVPVTINGDPVVYFLTKKSAESLLELL